MIGQTIRSSHNDQEHGSQCDRNTCCKVFVDVFPIVQNSKTKIINDTCAYPIMETELVNQGTDVGEDESQEDSNLSSET